MSKQYIGDLVLSQEQIKVGVSQVAQQLNQRFAGQDAVIVSVVPGGILFTADLVRELTFDISMDYISCPHTPGDRNNSSEIVFHQNIPLTGRNVILVDDAIESGGTMKRIAHFLQQEFDLNSLSIATLFVKPGRVDIPVTQHHAYVMENDDLLVGYGLPWQDQLRNIPYVSKLVVE
ncbi:hypoxanthine phosphoribosyltransferase [Vibrio ponticus]|uniref:Hypoxanthine phosphoribosyltransferase n=1 Tax=Vibrio ponticus TaxID=265668 RepID=A0ABX3FNF4_9VIBR|nr:phosphoribosyltransferase family protein [Vibrio ponticus]OLQ94291.1 hypoxanthine phosphoribosyltransferase [Vibrio ponticus]